MNALEIRGLTRRYRGFTLNNIDLTLPQGCILGLIGENGAGKSTTIRAILGLVHRDAGEIRVLGRDMEQDPQALKQEIGVVFDEGSYPEALSAREIERFLSKCYQNWDSPCFWRYMERFDLPKDRPFGEYSRGMKMKFSIAAALSHRARLLILDEPTSGLDPMVRDEIVETFLEFTRQPDHSILISSHIVSDLEKLCDYVAFLHRGQMMFCEEKDRLLEEYVLLHLSREQFRQLPREMVLGSRESTYQVEALVRRSALPAGMAGERTSLEDIIIFMARGERG